MSLAVLADHMASKGRNGDTMLVHMTPEEVQGLHALALAHGGKLTINPETGLPEANFLKRILPMVAGMALNAFLPGVGTAIGAALGGLSGAVGTGILVGGITGLAKGSLKEGILAGLGAYGGASLGGAFTGAESAGASAAAAEAAKTAGAEAATQGLTGEAANKFVQDAAAKGYSDFVAKPMLEQASGSFTALKDAPGTFGAFPSLARPAAMAAAPIMADLMVPTNVQMPMMNQPKYGPAQNYTYAPGLGYLYQGTQTAKSGGLVALADGGMADGGATREQVLAAYKANPLAELNPNEEAINYWMGQGLGGFNQAVEGARASNPMLAKQIDAARAVAQPNPLNLSTAGYNYSAEPVDVSKAAIISGTAPAGYSYADAAITNPQAQQINQLYRNILNRDVEQEGLNYWMGQAQKGLSMPEIEAQIRQISRDIGVAAPSRPANFVTPPVIESTPAPTLYTGTTPGVVSTGEPFTPAAPTMSEVKTAYETGGGATKMPVITDVKPTDRTYTQNEAFSLLQGYLKANPNAQYQDVVGFARSRGIPDMQAKAAYNEFRFSSMTGGTQQAYDYLMGRGAYPIRPFTATGEIMRPYEESVLGFPENRKAKAFIFDPATRRYVPNPDFVPRKSSTMLAATNPRDQAGNLIAGNAKSYFVANPDVYRAWQSGTTGMTADEYAKYHWETFGKKEGRSGWTETTGGGSSGGKGSTDDSSVSAGKAGGLMDIASAAAARGGNVQQYNLGGYSDGGRLLRGPGDGVSDSIPATIGNKQPARLADGEFVVPARIVSEIGNGSTEAGARKLYAMMDRVQRARSKTVGKGRVAKDTKAEQYLPA